MNEHPTYGDLASAMRDFAHDMKAVKDAVIGNELENKVGLIAQHRETRRRVRTLEVYANAVGGVLVLIMAGVILWLITGRAEGSGGAHAESTPAASHRTIQ